MQITERERDKFERLSELLKKKQRSHAWTYLHRGGLGFKMDKGSKVSIHYAGSEGHCGSAGCAMGLWDAKYPNEERPKFYDSIIADDVVFYGGDMKNNAQWRDVKPIDVALSIDRILNTGEVGLRDIVEKRIAREKRKRAKKARVK